MLYRLFRDRFRTSDKAASAVLASLLRAPDLRPHRFLRHCPVGPFIVEHACPGRAVIVELQQHALDTDARRQARLRLLEQLGYQIIVVTERELRHAPRRVLARVKAALQ